MAEETSKGEKDKVNSMEISYRDIDVNLIDLSLEKTNEIKIKLYEHRISEQKMKYWLQLII